MQTFLPYADFEKCAAVLDDKRLNKQLVECRQIFKAALGLTTGWVNHPAVKMWKYNLGSLFRYYASMAREWYKRTGKPHAAFGSFLTSEMSPSILCDASDPYWLGNEAVHASHRANLIRKDKEHYSKHFNDPSDKGYVWPAPGLCKAEYMRRAKGLSELQPGWDAHIPLTDREVDGLTDTDLMPTTTLVLMRGMDRQDIDLGEVVVK